MLGGCERCKTGTLTSFFEQRLKVCADCAAVMVDRCRTLEQEVPKLQEDLARTNEAKRALLESYDCETKGMMAASKGLSQDQNPFPAGSPSAQAWDVGWCRGELDRRTQQAAAVLEWAVLNLDLIENLCEGYGYGEIARKISSINEKLADFVEVK